MLPHDSKHHRHHHHGLNESQNLAQPSQLHHSSRRYEQHIDQRARRSRTNDDARTYYSVNSSEAFSRVSIEQNDTDYLNVPVPVSEDQAEDELDSMLAPRRRPGDVAVKRGGCKECLCGEKACGSKQYPICPELNDLENQAYLFFKTMCLKSAQMLVAFCFAFAVFVEWSFNQQPDDYPILVKIGKEFFWAIYVLIGLYVVIRVCARLTHFKEKRWVCLIVYGVLVVLVTVIVCMSGVVWELLFPTAVTMTLALTYFILGLLPLMSETMDIKNCCIHAIAGTLALILGVSCWLFTGIILGMYSAKVSMAFMHEGIENKLYLHCFPTVIVSEFIVLMDLGFIQNVLHGKQFPLYESSWALIAVYA